MYYFPVSGQPGAVNNGGTSMPPYPVSLLPPGTIPVQATTTTPPAAALSAAALSMSAQQQQQHYGARMPSRDYSLSAPGTPPHIPTTSCGSGVFTASPSGSVAGSVPAEPRQVLMMNAPGMPMGYSQVVPSGYVPVGSLPLMASGGYYPMAVYPSAPRTAAGSTPGEFGKSDSGPFFVSGPPAPLQSPSGVFSAQPSADFCTAVSFNTVPATFSGTFAPQNSSGAFFSDASGALRPPTSHSSGRTGDAGRGYEAGVYYEGRVKRFNPVRGFGFLSATHKLLRLKDVREASAAAAAAAATTKSLSSAESASFGESREAGSGDQQEKHTPVTLLSEDEKGNSANVHPTSTTTATMMKEAEMHDAPMINVIPLSAAATTDREIDLADTVLIKGEEYVRKPVVMGDIFVHYHCLQCTAAELESEQSGALVNLPAGARVQFKAEVFVPARLMEEAQDSKQAAVMLNNIGVPVGEDPNLLAGAIATKRGWGYQATNVVQLPAQAVNHLHNSNRLDSRSSHRGWARSPGNESTASRSSVNSVRCSNTPSQGKSDMEENSNALAPCSGKSLNIHVSLEESKLPPPPSFETATAGMTYVVPAPTQMVYYPQYTATMPR